PSKPSVGQTVPNIPATMVPVRIGLTPTRPSAKNSQGTAAATRGHHQKPRLISPTILITPVLITAPIKAEPPTMASSLPTWDRSGNGADFFFTLVITWPDTTTARQLRATA